MPEQLAHELQWATVQEQVNRKAVPTGMAPNLERRLSPNLLDQPVNIGTDRLARDRKDPLVLPKLPHPQVALDPGLEVPV
jgi:hypothetical protein